jgi:ABC-type dipeptide/oligopeptide/nickel transport system permease subunit
MATSEALLPTPSPSRRRVAANDFFHDLLRSGTGLFGLVVVVLIVGSALLAPWIATHEPTSQSLHDRLIPPLGFGGTTDHILGTDQLGRDLLSRVLHGARISLMIAGAVVVVAGGIGITLGLIAGYFGGLTDTLIMRAADMQLAFPGILLDLIILFALGPSAKLLIIVLALNGWMVYARITRSLVLPLRKADYIEAAEISGAKAGRIMRVHLLPNLTSPLITLAVLEFARIILAEAALSFLGYGIQPPQASWGLIVAQGQDYITVGWWLVTIPGLFIFLTVLGSNLLASWLRLYTDPKQREKQIGRRANRKKAKKA